MKIKYLLSTVLYVLFAICITSCEKSDISYYSETASAVRFPLHNSDFNDMIVGYNDIDETFYISYSFLDAGTSDKGSIIYNIPVMLIGNISSYSRSINYIINSKTSTAPKESYEILEAVIPANEYTGYIRIKLYNTEELEKTTYILTLLLTCSNELSAGPKEYITSQLSWNNQIPSPPNTGYTRTYNMIIAGENNFLSTSSNSYSNKALRVIVDALGWTNWDDTSAHSGLYNTDGYKYLPKYSFIYNDNSYQAYSAKVGEYIRKYNAEHPNDPLVHDGGKNIGKPIQSRYH